VQVEHVARIRFAARRAAQQQRHLAVGPGLLGQVVINDQRVLAAIAEVLAHRAAGIRRDVLHRRGFGGGGHHDDRVRHRAALFELAHDVRDGRGLLADRDVDTGEVFALLVDDRVDRDGSLAGLAIADDQFALAAADRHHRVDGLEAGLHRLAHGLAVDDARGDLLDDVELFRVHRAFAVDRLAECVHDAANQRRTDGHLEDAAGALDRVALGDVLVRAQDHRADRITLEVEREAKGVLRELEHFSLHRVLQAVDAADAVRDRHDAANAACFGRRSEVLDACLDQFADLRSFDRHVGSPLQACAASARRSGR
jgi:hypothetical protein